MNPIIPVIIAATVALIAVIAHVISITWFLRGIRSRNESITQIVDSLGKELRNQIATMSVSIDRLGSKIEEMMVKVQELSVDMAVTKEKVSTIEKRGDK